MPDGSVSTDGEEYNTNGYTLKSNNQFQVPLIYGWYDYDNLLSEGIINNEKLFIRLNEFYIYYSRMISASGVIVLEDYKLMVKMLKLNYKIIIISLPYQYFLK